VLRHRLREEFANVLTSQRTPPLPALALELPKDFCHLRPGPASFPRGIKFLPTSVGQFMNDRMPNRPRRFAQYTIIHQLFDDSSRFFVVSPDGFVQENTANIEASFAALELQSEGILHRARSEGDCKVGDFNLPLRERAEN